MNAQQNVLSHRAANPLEPQVHSYHLVFCLTLPHSMYSEDCSKTVQPLHKRYITVALVINTQMCMAKLNS